MRNLMSVMAGALLAACTSSQSLSAGQEAESRVAGVLAESQAGDAALVNGHAVYAIPSDALVAERAELVRSLRAAPYKRRDFSSGASVRAFHAGEFALAAEGVTAWVRSEVFEAAYSAGTIHVERSMFPDDPRANYRVLLIDGSSSYFGGVKQGDALDRAWKRLADAARTQSTLQIDGVSGERPRPLRDLQRVGVDFRGLAE